MCKRNMCMLSLALVLSICDCASTRHGLPINYVASYNSRVSDTALQIVRSRRPKTRVLVPPVAAIRKQVQKFLQNPAPWVRQEKPVQWNWVPPIAASYAHRRHELFAPVLVPDGNRQTLLEVTIPHLDDIRYICFATLLAAWNGEPFRSDSVLRSVGEVVRIADRLAGGFMWIQHVHARKLRELAYISMASAMQQTNGRLLAPDHLKFVESLLQRDARDVRSVAVTCLGYERAVYLSLMQYLCDGSPSYCSRAIETRRADLERSGVRIGVLDKQGGGAAVEAIDRYFEQLAVLIRGDYDTLGTLAAAEQLDDTLRSTLMLKGGSRTAWINNS